MRPGQAERVSAPGTGDPEHVGEGVDEGGGESQVK
jgi:hypothetical protein